MSQSPSNMVTTGHRILVLEDDDNRIEVFREVLSQHAVSYATTAKDCIELLEREQFDVLFLDHDLGGLIYVPTGHTNTGSEVVRWLRLHIQDINPYIIIHSHNHVAAERMEQDLKAAAFTHVHRISFGDLCKRHFRDPSFLA